MSDFRKMAEEAKRASDERVAARQAKENADIVENKTIFLSNVKALKDLVSAPLEEAVKACGEVGATAHLENNFKDNVGRYKAPPARIEFWCTGPGQVLPTLGYRNPESFKATFEYSADGGFMKLSRSTSGERLELTNDPLGAVSKALEAVLDSYFKSVENLEAQRVRP
jgi:hypothetical protein